MRLGSLLLATTSFASLSLSVSAFSLASLGRASIEQFEAVSSKHRGHAKTGDEAVYGAFVDHFSTPFPSNEVFLQSTISRLFPNSTLTVTQDFNFNLLGFAASNPDQIVIRELEDLESLKKVSFIPPRRRREGENGGSLVQGVILGGWRVGWGDQEVVAIVASWSEGFARYTQWHLISDKDTTSKSLIHAVGSWNRVIREAILVFDQGYWQADHGLWQSVQGASWEDVILDQEFKTRLQKDYRSFYKSEEIYKELQVPWKRGLILLGPPGNGKTISLKAMMNDVKVPVLYVKSFRTYQGDEFGIRQVFERARAEAPCLLVLEDLDALINDMNRSFFLNEVDGIEDNDGLLLIGTTNHFDRLDPALSSRPSRFDRKYDFPNPKRDERRQYAVYWQKKLRSNIKIVFPDSLLDEIADKTDKFSFAYLKEVFVSSLLTLAGLDDPKSAPPFSEIVLDQIKKIREQFESGKEARISAGRESGDGDEGVDVGRTYPAWGGQGPGQIENEMASFIHEVWVDQDGDSVDMDKVGQGSGQEGEEAFWKEKMMGGRPGGAGGPGQVVMGV